MGCKYVFTCCIILCLAGVSHCAPTQTANPWQRAFSSSKFAPVKTTSSSEDSSAASSEEEYHEAAAPTDWSRGTTTRPSVGEPAVTPPVMTNRARNATPLAPSDQLGVNQQSLDEERYMAAMDLIAMKTAERLRIMFQQDPLIANDVRYGNLDNVKEDV
ncbi:hypothetical protein RvY_03017 [Ramazzottius varieornatus]|uniref:Secreted protein n=1 Tax=Ramazzottius varieornatus TaxID=947166 RepID=A0A1D1ULM9_RAMVA|nr:hypothetical protein RvY_03017 [Ramazzottius varieornatus]